MCVYVCLCGWGEGGPAISFCWCNLFTAYGTVTCTHQRDESFVALERLRQLSDATCASCDTQPSGEISWASRPAANFFDLSVILKKHLAAKPLEQRVPVQCYISARLGSPDLPIWVFRLRASVPFAFRILKSQTVCDTENPTLLW